MSRDLEVLKGINEFYDNQIRFHHDIQNLIKALENKVLPALPVEQRPMLRHYIESMHQFKTNPFSKPLELSKLLASKQIDQDELCRVMDQTAQQLRHSKNTIHAIGIFAENFNSFRQFIEQRPAAFIDSFLDLERTGRSTNFLQEIIKPVQTLPRYDLTLKQVKESCEKLITEDQKKNIETSTLETSFAALEEQRKTIVQIAQEHNAKIKNQAVTQRQLMWEAIKNSLLQMKANMIDSKKEYASISKKMDVINLFQLWGDQLSLSGYISPGAIKNELNKLLANGAFKSDNKSRSKLKMMMKYISQCDKTFDNPKYAVPEVFSQPSSAGYLTKMVTTELHQLIESFAPQLKEYKNEQNTVEVNRLVKLIVALNDTIKALDQPFTNQATQIAKINEQMNFLAANRDLQEGLFLAASFNKISSLASIATEVQRECYKPQNIQKLIFDKPSSNTYFAEIIRAQLIQLRKEYEAKEMSQLKRGHKELAAIMEKSVSAFTAAIKALSFNENEHSDVNDLSFREIQKILRQLLQARAPLQSQRYASLWNKSSTLLLEPEITNMIKGFQQVIADKRAEEFDALRVMAPEMKR